MAPTEEPTPHQAMDSDYINFLNDRWEEIEDKIVNELDFWSRGERVERLEGEVKEFDRQISKVMLQKYNFWLIRWMSFS